MKSQAFLRFIVLAFALLVLRVFFLAVTNLPLDCEEAQYWFWSQTLDWGYFSKPPVTSWLMAFTTSLGGETAFWVRVGSPVCHTLTALVLYFWAQALFGEKKATYAGLIYLTFPGIFFSSVLMTTDVPMLLFSACAGYFMWHAYELNKRRDWVAAGAFLGLAFLGKYIAVFLPLSFVLFLSIVSRKTVYQSGFWIMLGVAFFVVSPNLYWQLSQGFPTFHHTAHSNIALQSYGKNFHILKALEYILGQAALFGPLFFIAFFRPALWKNRSDKDIFLHCLIWPIFLAMIIQALMAKVNVNWGVFMALGAVLLVSYRCTENRLKWILITNTVVGVLGLALLVDYKASSTLFGFSYKGHAYHRTLEKLEAFKKQEEKHGEPLRLITGHRCVASLGRFYASYQSVDKWFLGERVPHDHFDKVSPFSRQKSISGTFLIYTGHTDSYLKPFFSSLSKLGEIEGKPAFLAKNFKSRK